MAEVKDNPIINHIAAAAEAQARNTATQRGVLEQMDEEKKAASAAIMARTAMGNADQTVLASQSALAASKDALGANIRAEFGADATKVGSESNYWLKEMQDNAHKAYASLDVINEKRQKTLLNDPIGFINAQFTLPADIDTHNYYADKHNIAEDALVRITSASDANVIAAHRAAATTSTELAVAQGEKAAQMAAFDVAQIKERAAGTRIQALGTLNQLDAQRASLALQMHQSANSDRGLALQEQAHKDLMEDRKLRREQMAEMATAKQQTLEDAEDMRKSFNAAAKRNKQAEIPDARTWRTVMQANAKDPDFWSKVAAGQQLMLNGGNSTGIPVASSAGHAALVYATGGTNLKHDSVAQFLFDRLAEVKSLPTAPKDKEELAAVVTVEAKKVAGNMHRRIDPNSANIYSAPPVSTVMEAVSTATDPFLVSVVKPLLDLDKNTKIPDDVMLGKALDIVTKDRNQLNAVAAGIAKYYTVAIQQNNLLKEFVEKGVPAQTNYKAVVGGRILDLSDPIAVKAMLMKNSVPGFTFTQPSVSF